MMHLLTASKKFVVKRVPKNIDVDVDISLKDKKKFFIKFDFLCPYLNNKSLFNLFIHIEDGYSSDM